MILLVIHSAATWFMVGLIWMVQVVHYPLFAQVAGPGFEAYERSHTRRMGALLLVPAVAEIATAAALAWVRPEGLSFLLIIISGGLLFSIWLITALVQVPLHRRLSNGYDLERIKRLVSTNWWRTSLWSLRGLVVAAMWI